MTEQAALLTYDEAGYHADHSRVSHSMLEVFRGSRARYHGRFVTKDLPADPDTDAMRFGRLFHMAVLEPERYHANVIVAPDVDRRTKDGKAEWQAFVERSNGKTIVSFDTCAQINAMARAIRENAAASALLKDVYATEQSIGWTDPGTGIECKCRRDACTGGIVDLKSADDPSPEAFARAAVRYGYHRQDAWYRWGDEMFTGIPCLFFRFLVVGKHPPHEVAIYELDAAAVELGTQQNRKLLDALAECRRANDWSSPWTQGPMALSLPPWAHTESQWEI